MANARLDAPLRLWPGILAVALQWFARFGLPAISPDLTMYGILAGVAGGLAVLIWWGFFSRAPRAERFGAIVLLAAALAITPRTLHPSMATGMMGMLFFIYAIPVLSLAFVLWAVATRRLSRGPRLALMAATVLVSCGAWALLRTDGMTGAGKEQFAWRWSPTHEDLLLSQPRIEPQVPVLEAAKPAIQEQARAAEWPGFRGPNRDSTVRGVRIASDWAASAPVELWRRSVGPGWSSFAVDGDVFYTQEQRGDNELVVCYRLSTGKPVWTHSDATRFWESNAGAGPRGTPTLHGGRVYTFGATGIVNALDARTGKVQWTQNAASDTETKVPDWGFSSSPLVTDDVVMVAASGKLIAYDAVSGAPRWKAEPNGGSYSSPHRVVIEGIPQVVLLGGSGASSFRISDGKPLWQHPWPGTTIIQPASTADGDILLTTGDLTGGIRMRRIKVAHGSGGWSVDERWTSTGLKPYFNDFVVHNGNAYGFDGRILSCIGLDDGQRKWKGGRYGYGQLILVADANLLLVLSEEGELALVSATPDEFKEVARMKAIEGKTWNHPVLVGDTVLVRNGEEMAAFRIPITEAKTGR